MTICVRDAGMPRKDFIPTFPKNETNTTLARQAHPRQAQAFRGAASPARGDREAAEEAAVARRARAPVDRRGQGDQPRSGGRRSEGAAREEGDGRGEPAPRDLHREEVHEPRPAVPRPDPGRQHRPDEGGRQVRIPPRLQVLDVCDVVDPAGDHALDRRPGAHDPHPGAHDRDDQQAQPHFPADAAGDGARADAGGAGGAHGDAGGQGPPRAQDRQRADLDGDARSATTRIRTWGTSSRTPRWTRRSTPRRWSRCARRRTPCSPA